jgi:hypothetical protein
MFIMDLHPYDIECHDITRHDNNVLESFSWSVWKQERFFWKTSWIVYAWKKMGQWVITSIKSKGY